MAVTGKLNGFLLPMLKGVPYLMFLLLGGVITGTAAWYQVTSGVSDNAAAIMGNEQEIEDRFEHVSIQVESNAVKIEAVKDDTAVLRTDIEVIKESGENQEKALERIEAAIDRR